MFSHLRRPAWSVVLPLFGFWLFAGCGDSQVTLTAGRAEPTKEQLAALREKYPPPTRAEVASALPLTMFREWEVQQVAADALARIGEPAIPELVRLLEDPHPKTRARAAWALGRMGPKGTAAVPALAAALQDEDRTVQESAARALGQIGPQATEAIPDLVRLMTSPSEIEIASPAPIGRANWMPP